MSAVIRFDHVCLRYTGAYAGGLKDRLFDLCRGRRQRQVRRPALDDVSFTIAAGESVAVIGRNGSGKSTTLGLMARVLHPTSGSVQVAGTVAPLLELGAGFHPDLDGIENVRLNAVLLGMGRHEAHLAVNRILAFADIGDAAMEPVRTYSTGMLARLGFAVAISVPCDILLIDEVLAVGDAAFQAKCLAVIAERSRQGTTIVYVGHRADAAREICRRGILLTGGRLAFDGPLAEAYQSYERSLAG